MRSIGFVHEAADALRVDDLHGSSGAELAAQLTALRRVIDALEAQWLRRLAVFDQRGDALGTGAVSTAAWLRSACQLSAGAARGRVALARALPARPVVAAAFAAGDISLPHAQHVVAATEDLTNSAGAEVAAEAEAALVAVARLVDPSRLRRELVHVRHALIPESVHAAAEDARERRWLSVSETFEGMFAVDGLLDPEGGALLLAALHALARPAGPTDRRSARQRRADGLVELCRRQLDSGQLPGSGGERPHLIVTVELATLERRAGARAAELGWAGPIGAEAARRLACDAEVSRVIISGPSQPLDVGRRTRSIPPAIRTALVVRDGGCAYPGCDRPPQWTDAHHIQHWADGGSTSLDNLVLLCRAHHRAVHEGRAQLTGSPARARPGSAKPAPAPASTVRAA